MTRKCCRIWPNGEFSIWAERATTKIEPQQGEVDFLGLSLLPNSHRVALGMADPPPKRRKRGSKGITRLGARTVRNGAFLLQQTYGNDRLAFCTFTLPNYLESEQYLIATRWAEIVRKFMQAMGRVLKAAGLPGSMVGCTEIQEKRYKTQGGLPLHLHLVFVGRHARKDWLISANQYRAMWKNAIENEFPNLKGASFKASVDCQGVKRDMSAYLGKYMSKGSGVLAQILEDDPDLGDLLPSSWWTCSLKLRRAIGRRITGGYSTAEKLLRDIRAGDSRIKSSHEVKVELGKGEILTVAVVGALTGEGRGKYCWREGGIIGIDSD